MPAEPQGVISRSVGNGTTEDPLIMWLNIQPPRLEARKLGNEQVARALGGLGYTHVWIRSCDHKTTRVPPRKARIPTDNHITVYCGTSLVADKQGDVFLVVEDGVYRVMEDFERAVNTPGQGIELYDY